MPLIRVLDAYTCGDNLRGSGRRLQWRTSRGGWRRRSGQRKIVASIDSKRNATRRAGAGSHSGLPCERLRTRRGQRDPAVVDVVGPQVIVEYVEGVAHRVRQSTAQVGRRVCRRSTGGIARNIRQLLLQCEGAAEVEYANHKKNQQRQSDGEFRELRGIFVAPRRSF